MWLFYFLLIYYYMRIADSHNDFLTYYKTIQQKRNYLYRLSYGDLKILNAVFWSTESKNPLSEVRKNCSVLFTNNKNKIKIIYTIEDIGFCNIEDVENFYINKVDFCGLVWNYKNKFGSGVLGNTGLTSIGKQIIKKLEAKNIIIDTAHMNEKTFIDFLAITEKPIYNSHSNFYSLYKNDRNLKNWQISEIIRTNGFIGLSFVRDFITGKEEFSSYDIAKQIKFFIDKWGENNIGLGSDFFGTQKLPKDLKKYTQIKNLEKNLLSLGVDKKSIDKIFYLNYYNFLKRVNKI